MKLLLSLGVSLGLTLALELGFALLEGVRKPKELGLVALVNVLTNPVVVLVYLLSAGLAPLLRTLLKLALELGAVIMEWRIYRYCSSIPYPLRFSICANLFSYGMGVMLNQLF